MTVLIKRLSSDTKEIIFVSEFFFSLYVECFYFFYKEKIPNYCIDMKVCNDRVKIPTTTSELFMAIQYIER